MTLRYQLFVGGPESLSRMDSCLEEFYKGFEAFGLNRHTDFDLCNSSDFQKRIDHKGIPVGLWFGSAAKPDRADTAALKSLLESGVPFLPVVNDLSNYNNETPELLHRINGVPAGDDKHIASLLLGLFHLTPLDRRVFISYSRKGSFAIAKQLFEALSLQGFNVFFDIASVRHGGDFQRILLDRLNDFDLVVLLDSEEIDYSHWVQEEIITAHHLGTGFFHIIWPDRNPKKIFELNQPRHLHDNEFAPQTAHLSREQKTLLPDAVKKIAREIESFRIRSLGGRRQRIVNEFLSLVAAYNKYFGSNPIECHINPGREIWLKKKDKVFWIWPSTRQPNSLLIHQKSEEPKNVPTKYLECTKDEQNDKILFDSLGVHDETLFHLCWLRKHLPFQTLSLDMAKDWLVNI